MDVRHSNDIVSVTGDILPPPEVVTALSTPLPGGIGEARSLREDFSYYDGIIPKEL